MSLQSSGVTASSPESLISRVGVFKYETGFRRECGILVMGFGGLAVLIGGLPLLSFKTEPDLGLAATTFCIGIAMVIGGFLLFRRPRSWRAGQRYCQGVLWDSEAYIASSGRMLLSVYPQVLGQSVDSRGFLCSTEHRVESVTLTKGDSFSYQHPDLTIILGPIGLEGIHFAARKVMGSEIIVLFAENAICLKCKDSVHNGGNMIDLCKRVSEFLRPITRTKINLRVLVVTKSARLQDTNRGGLPIGTKAAMVGGAFGGVVGAIAGKVAGDSLESGKQRGALERYQRNAEFMTKIADDLCKLSDDYGWRVFGP